MFVSHLTPDIEFPKDNLKYVPLRETDRQTSVQLAKAVDEGVLEAWGLAVLPGRGTPVHPTTPLIKTQFLKKGERELISLLKEKKEEQLQRFILWNPLRTLNRELECSEMPQTENPLISSYIFRVFLFWNFVILFCIFVRFVLYFSELAKSKRGV